LPDPAGGGCKEFALRAAEIAKRQAGNDPSTFLQNVFTTIAMAHVSKSAWRRRTWASLAPATTSFQRQRVALRCHPARPRHGRSRLAATAARPGVAVAGRPGIATLEMMLVNMKEGA